MEMLAINLATTHFCSDKKPSLIKVMSVETGFTAIILALAVLLRHFSGIPYLPSYMIVILGFAYFFPLRYLYGEEPVKTLSVMTFSWIHTLSVTSICLNLTYRLSDEKGFLISLLLQSFIFIISTPLIIKFVKTRFKYILANIAEKYDRFLFLPGFLLLTILVVSQQFTADGANQYLKAALTMVVIFTANFGYLLIYNIVKNTRNINILKSLAYSDSLTGVKNRLALFLDCEELISDERPFNIIYMDLDNFKRVNDTYGHATGDEYLKRFTEAAVETARDRGTVYRMSGDEFVFLCEKCDTDGFMDSFNENISDFIDMDIPFLGVSMGKARYPEDADSVDGLLQIADKIMYRVKKNR